MIQKIKEKVTIEGASLKNKTGKIYFPIVFHIHQPVDNFDFVFENAYQQSYLPLLQCIDRHPAIKVGIHISGPVLEWLDQQHPEYMALLANLVNRKQVEIIGGAFFVFGYIYPHQV